MYAKIGSERAILAAKNIDVDALNFIVQNMLSGELISFKSIDTVVDENEIVNFPTEFLNHLDLPGRPPQNLQLKIGSPKMLLRHINPPRLCKGTQLVVKKIKINVIKSTIINSKFKGEHVLIPHIPMISSGSPI